MGIPGSLYSRDFGNPVVIIFAGESSLTVRHWRYGFS